MGRDMAGIELNGAPVFPVGSTVDAGARDKSPELIREEMDQKIEAGAEFFITPPLFDLSTIEPFLKRVDRKRKQNYSNGSAAQIPWNGALYIP